jgi:hypothetical protein
LPRSWGSALIRPAAGHDQKPFLSERPFSGHCGEFSRWDAFQRGSGSAVIIIATKPAVLERPMSESPVYYDAASDMMQVELRPWPGGEGENYGGEDAGPGLVIHYAPDGTPWMWEIENASTHPEHSPPHWPSCAP